MQESNWKHLGESIDDIREAMTFSPNEPRTFHRFLDKFRILDEIKWTESLIDRSVKAICAQLDRDNVHYTWLDFSINKYMEIGWGKVEAINFIHDAFKRYRPNGVGLILSLKYESLRTSQRQYAKLIEHEDMKDKLIGIDLVGDEEMFDAHFYAPIFEDWNKARKITRAHVGESQSIVNVIAAINIMKATNIAHGLKAVYNPLILEMAKDNNITFDMAITSNYITGVWTNLANHPALNILRSGVKVTLGSDDPVQCGVTLQSEFEKARQLGWSDEDILLAQRIAVENSKPFVSLLTL